VTANGASEAQANGSDLGSAWASEEYHLSELRIALSESDPRRILPSIPQGGRRILDVGCGAGQTLIASKLDERSFLCGIDVDFMALRLGRRLAPNILFVAAQGERIPFQAASFDVLICRVALPYLGIGDALGEFRRVLRPGGFLWLVLQPFKHTATELRNSLREGRLKDAIFRFYVMVNGLVFNLTGRQFRFPLGHGRQESFQTSWGIRRALLSNGFHQIKITHEPHFVVTAVGISDPFVPSRAGAT
jgi:SAM-dependent methyltransferase